MIDERFEDALREAREIDQEVQSQLKTAPISKHGVRTVLDEKPLLGVPFTTKDFVAVKGMLWTTGLKCRQGTRATEDASTIAALRSAGGIPIAITICPGQSLRWPCGGMPATSSMGRLQIRIIS